MHFQSVEAPVGPFHAKCAQSYEEIGKWANFQLQNYSFTHK